MLKFTEIKQKEFGLDNEIMNKNSRITLITVVYNSVSTIETTMLSVLNQDCGNIEYIIVDGASTDGTLDIITHYETRIKNREFPNVDFRYISEPDKGIYDAMNKGIAMATGEWIGIINSGDWYEDGIIRKIADTLIERSLIQIIHGKMNVYDAEGIFFQHIASPPSSAMLIKQIPLLHPTFFVHKNVYAAIGLFSLEYKIASDYDFSLRCYLGGINFYCVPFVITNFCLGGCSDVQMIEGFKECKRISIENGVGLFRSNMCFLIRIIKAKTIHPLCKLFF